MKQRKRLSSKDVVRFLEERAPGPGTVLESNPFKGRKFHIDDVIEALDEVAFPLGLSDIRPYDIPGTINIWTDEGEYNYEMAREATKAMLKNKKRNSPDSWEEIFPGISRDDFESVPINRFGTRLGGMLQLVYRHSPYDAIRDLIDNDDEFKEYRDLQPYDMRRDPNFTWVKADGTPNRETIAITMALLVREKQRLDSGSSLEKILTHISQDDLASFPVNRYGTRVTGMNRLLKGHVYAAVRILVEKDPDFKGYSDLEPFDMHVSPNALWVKKDAKAFKIARKGMRQLIKAKKAQNPGMSLGRVLASLTADDFNTLEINRYGTVLSGAYRQLFRNSPYDAVMDLITNDRHFSKYSGMMPYHMAVSPNWTWVNKDGSPNLEMARKATKELIGRLQEANSSKPLERVLSELSITDFHNVLDKRFQTPIGGGLSMAYRNSPFLAIRDLVAHDPDFASFSDMQPYDMRYSPGYTWVSRKGEKNFELARELTLLTLDKLGINWRELPLEETIRQAGFGKFIKTPANRYGTTMESPVMLLYDRSSSVAITDAITHSKSP